MRYGLLSPRRAAYGALLLSVSAVGTASRVMQTGSLLLDKYLGDAVYAVVFYLFLGLVWEQGRPVSRAVWTLAFVLAVEVFQLTLIPLYFRLSGNPFLRFLSILLGTQFAWLDILAYLVGVAGVYLADRFWISRLGPGPATTPLEQDHER